MIHVAGDDERNDLQVRLSAAADTAADTGPDKWEPVREEKRRKANRKNTKTPRHPTAHGQTTTV